MEPSTIFFIVCIIVLIYLVYYSYFFSAGNLLSSVVVGNTETIIKPPVSETGIIPATGTYSLWINVNDWAYNKSFYKNILTHQTLTPDQGSVSISLDHDSNNVVVAIRQDNTTNKYISASIDNIPLQTWVHLAVVVNQKTFDLYLNGKLIKTTMLLYVFKPSPASGNQIVLGGTATTPTSCNDSFDTTTELSGCGKIFSDVSKKNPGFSGWITRFNYFQDAKDPQTIWNMYLEGSGVNNFLSNLFGNYGLSISLTSDGVVSNTISI